MLEILLLSGYRNIKNKKIGGNKMKLFFKKYSITILLVIALVFVNINSSIADTIYAVTYGFDYGWWDIDTTFDGLFAKSCG